MGSMEFPTLSALFAHVWASRPHICGVCGRPVPAEPRAHMFAHRLAKGPWKALAFEPANIELVCSVACHHAVDARRTALGPLPILAAIRAEAARGGRALPAMKCGFGESA